MKVAVLLSSGKDSMFAMQKAIEEGHKVVGLITVISKNKDSWMFHTPNIRMVEYQAKCLDLPLIKKETEGEKEKELSDLKQLIAEAKQKYKIEGVVSGAVHSRYQWNRIDKICGDLELVSIAPLWGYDQEQLIRDLLDNQYEIIISSIACEGLNERWLGRKIDKIALNELVELNRIIGINIAGEGGEYESLVLDCPLFKKRINIIKSRKNMESTNAGRLEIDKCKIVKK